MKQMIININGQNISLAVRRHAWARRISLRLSPARDGVILTLTPRASQEAGMAFLRRKASWVLANIEQDRQVPFAAGAVIPLLGKHYTICHHGGRGIAYIDPQTSQLHVYGDAAFIARRVRDALIKYVQAICLARAQEMASLLDKTIRNVTIRDTRSRWGSCTASGQLTFHWRLVFAPPDVLEYLIAHETAHLVELNHSPRFWAVVARLCPHYISTRRWLKREGHRLHRYG